MLIRSIKRLLRSSAQQNDDFLECYSFQFFAKFLPIHDAPPYVWHHLGRLVAERQSDRCLEGPFEVCEHHAEYRGKKQEWQLERSDEIRNNDEYESKDESTDSSELDETDWSEEDELEAEVEEVDKHELVNSEKRTKIQNHG